MREIEEEIVVTMLIEWEMTDGQSGQKIRNLHRDDFLTNPEKLALKLNIPRGIN